MGFPTSHAGSLDPYSMKILGLCCTTIPLTIYFKVNKENQVAENQVPASPLRISHPEGDFPQELVYAVKDFNRKEIVHVSKISFIYCHDLVTEIH